MRSDEPCLDEPGAPGGDAMAVERVVADCWREVFHLDHVDMTQSFFDLDGNSLLAKRLFGEIEARLGCKIPFRLIFDAPSAGELAAQVCKIVSRSA